MREMFYVLSLKWSKGDADNLVWWKPDNKGYTTVLDRAGKYTADQIVAHPGYYNDGVDTLAVPCEVVEAATIRVVSDDGETIRRFRAVASPDVAGVLAKQGPLTSKGD